MPVCLWVFAGKRARKLLLAVLGSFVSTEDTHYTAGLLTRELAATPPLCPKVQGQMVRAQRRTKEHEHGHLEAVTHINSGWCEWIGRNPNPGITRWGGGAFSKPLRLTQ